MRRTLSTYWRTRRVGALSRVREGVPRKGSTTRSESENRPKGDPEVVGIPSKVGKGNAVPVGEGANAFPIGAIRHAG